MTITLTKDLPTEEGWYYFASCGCDHLIEIVRIRLIWGDLIFDDIEERGHRKISEVNGYWSKIGKEHFKFEGL